MTLPVSGAISFNAINVELGVAGATQASLGQASYRTLAGVASGAISMSNFYGKSNRATPSLTYSVNTANASVNVTTLSGYVAGKSDITITINSGVYVYSTSTGSAGLTLTGGTSGDTITIVNNGYILGQGGRGSNGNRSPNSVSNATAGGPALSIGFATTVNNTNGAAYIGGGGGGGGGTGLGLSEGGGGGGGAGGGAGGDMTKCCCGSNLGGSGGAGGGPGASGSTGTAGGYPSGGGGGGGRIFPGTGGAGRSGGNGPGVGGGSGGGGGAEGGNGTGGAGGSANAAGGTGSVYGAGGGGGWGASGGNAGTAGPAAFRGGAGGGKAVNLNGNAITWVSGNTTRVYGTVS